MTQWIQTHVEELSAAAVGGTATPLFLHINYSNLINTLFEAVLVALVSGAVAAVAGFYVKKLLKKFHKDETKD